MSCDISIKTHQGKNINSVLKVAPRGGLGFRFKPLYSLFWLSNYSVDATVFLFILQYTISNTCQL